MNNLKETNLSQQIAVERALPVNLDSKDLHLFKKELSKEINAAKLLYLKNSLVSHDGIVIEKFQIHPDSISIESLRKQLEYRFLLKLKLGYKKLGTISEGIAVHNYYWNGYFHWMTEILTKLMVLQNKYQDIPILMPTLKACYQQETIEAFDLQNVLELREKEYVKVKELGLVESTAPSGNYNPEVIRSLAELLKKRLLTKELDTVKSKVFISRRKAPKRKITNESEIEVPLKRYGYKVLCMEDYSFKEQLQITSNAEVLISLHGAGLTNMMFMPLGSKVFELRFKDDDHNNCYFSLAAAFEHGYYYQRCESSKENKSTHSGDVHVELDKFEQILKLIENN
jgi:capsular polysaccharide biosynthesis protein